jgi:hypothetical protein
LTFTHSCWEEKEKKKVGERKETFKKEEQKRGTKHKYVKKAAYK